MNTKNNELVDPSATFDVETFTINSNRTPFDDTSEVEDTDFGGTTTRGALVHLAFVLINQFYNYLVLLVQGIEVNDCLCDICHNRRRTSNIGRKFSDDRGSLR